MYWTNLLAYVIILYNKPKENWKMKTDILALRSDLKGKDAAMETAEKFALYHGLTGRSAMHLRLLTEETISMMNGILDDFSGDLWLESEKTRKGLLCRICLSAKKSANEKQEDNLLSVATSGKNESARGIMGKIREILRWSLQESDINDIQSNPWFTLGTANCAVPANVDTYLKCWSLSQYRENVSSGGQEKKEEWDELEKSIIANIADEVKVWLNKDDTEIVIEKLFAQQ